MHEVDITRFFDFDVTFSIAIPLKKLYKVVNAIGAKNL